MSGLPVEVRTERSGLIGGSLSPVPSMEPRTDGSDKLGQGTVPEVKTEKIGLPQNHPPHPVLEEGDRARVLLVHGNASGGSGVSSFVESPIGCCVATTKGLFPGKVCLDPGDSS